jgi:S1-C subfamily serine protease
MAAESVMTIGNPFGLAQTVSHGVISARRRTFPSSRRSFVSFIQTDAAIHPGNSGGPLINLVGEIVGISTAFLKAGPRIGLVIPVDVAKRVYRDIRRYGRVRHPDLGLRIGFTRELGVRVTWVKPGGPAARAGIRPQDIVQEIRNFIVSDRRIFWRIVRGLIPGDRVTVVLKRRRVKLTVGGTLTPPPALANEAFERRLGISLGNAAEYSDLLRLKTRRGAVLLTVRRGSRAWRRNLRRGDVIIRVGRRAIRDVPDLNRAVRNLVTGHQFIIGVQRGLKTYRFVMRY